MTELFGWQLSHSIPTFLVCIFVLVASAYLSFQTWKRNGAKRTTLVMEIIRTLLVFLVLLTLLNPEKIRRIERNQKAKIICLLDESNSMETRVKLNRTLTALGLGQVISDVWTPMDHCI